MRSAVAGPATRIVRSSSGTDRRRSARTWSAWSYRVVPQPQGSRLVTRFDIVAVDGVELDATMNPYSLFDRTAGRQTVLTINDKPKLEGAREITVVPVGNEIPLREREWMEGNRRKVDELSEGRLAYVWVPDTYESAPTPVAT